MVLPPLGHRHCVPTPQARLLAVELLCLVLVGGFVWQPLRRRLLPRRRRREAAEYLQMQAKLERKAKLQEHLSRQMQERQLEHAHRLAALQLRLSLLRTPRQAGIVRARAASVDSFREFWAELRRDKKIYFYREMPTQAQGAPPLPVQSLAIAGVIGTAVVSVDTNNPHTSPRTPDENGTVLELHFASDTAANAHLLSQIFGDEHKRSEGERAKAAEGLAVSAASSDASPRAGSLHPRSRTGSLGRPTKIAHQQSMREAAASPTAVPANVWQARALSRSSRSALASSSPRSRLDLASSDRSPRRARADRLRQPHRAARVAPRHREAQGGRRRAGRAAPRARVQAP